jgi:parvulin-like peptidyl-prolyl isomerase
LGWFGPGKMVKEFEEACRKLGVGSLSQPVKTQFGFHVIKLTGKK